MGAVPLPPFDARFVYDPTSEDARFFLTGGLPRPERTVDGHGVCPYCDRKTPLQRVITHVKGASPVRMIADHRCRQKVT